MSGRQQGQQRQQGGYGSGRYEGHQGGGGAGGDQGQQGRFSASYRQQQMMAEVSDPRTVESLAGVRRGRAGGGDNGGSVAAAANRAPNLVSKQGASKTLASDRMALETDEDKQRVATRLKNIAYGYNTRGYDRYMDMVPKNRRKGYQEHPRTPDPYDKVSRRCWEGRVKVWRKALHVFDPPEGEDVLELAGIMGGMGASAAAAAAAAAAAEGGSQKDVGREQQLAKEEEEEEVRYTLDSKDGSKAFKLVESPLGKAAPPVDVALSGGDTASAGGGDDEDDDDDDVL